MLEIVYKRDRYIYRLACQVMKVNLQPAFQPSASPLHFTFRNTGLYNKPTTITHGQCEGILSSSKEVSRKVLKICLQSVEPILLIQVQIYGNSLNLLLLLFTWQTGQGFLCFECYLCLSQVLFIIECAFFFGDRMQQKIFFIIVLWDLRAKSYIFYVDCCYVVSFDKLLYILSGNWCPGSWCTTRWESCKPFRTTTSTQTSTTRPHTTTSSSTIQVTYLRDIIINLMSVLKALARKMDPSPTLETLSLFYRLRTRYGSKL